MATGPEHYQAAENCLNATIHHDEDAPTLLAEAQVHATLALAAATAMCAGDTDGMSEPDFEAWDEVCGVQPGPAPCGQVPCEHAPDGGNHPAVGAS